MSVKRPLAACFSCPQTCLSFCESCEAHSLCSSFRSTLFPLLLQADFQTYANETNLFVPASQGVTYIKHVMGPDRAAAEAELGANFTQYGIPDSNGSPTFVTRDLASEV